ncbi:MAG: RecQ family ATP-dependent DNA helicase [Williamsia sp.]|nr:RecQ family ATP-dependent DNA helicase [Williamsia sp.]
MKEKIYSILRQYWGYETFRPLQEQIIQSVLSGKDTLALLPTGGGKSLCFQVPALAKDGLCLVISPLIALMKDQVENLRKKDIAALAIFSGMSQKEVANTLQTAAESKCRFLYVSPERLETNLFLEYLPALPINLLAVDEAHCISQWGYDFRPPYLRIAAIRKKLPGVPVLALTASATALVQKDICDKLKFRRTVVIRQSFERPNLSYSAFRVDSKISKLVEILTKVSGSGIVYCRSRKRTKELAEQLVSYNIQSDYYHAGLSADERSRKQEEWINNKIRIIVCTNAFGMGIDKPDVRIVVHVDAPECIENYYQEAGRAGRDRQKAYAVLLYRNSDIIELERQPEIRFPSLKNIRTVYQAVVNYLQIPSGLGEGNYYDYDLTDFLHKFPLDAQLTANTLKVLAQENKLSFNEQVFLPAKLVFTCNKAALYDLERTHPQLDPLVKALLRSHEGIFDHDTTIQEKSLAFLLYTTQADITAKLQQLQAFGIVRYQPQKDTPQLFFFQNRVKAEDLHIDMRGYNERKQLYIDRLTAFVQWIKSSACRSQAIGRYFGDENIQPCGVCDNCLRQKKNHLSKEDFQLIEQRILTALHEQPLPSRELLLHLKGINKEKVWKVIEFLQAEKKIDVNGTGLIVKT